MIITRTAERCEPKQQSTVNARMHPHLNTSTTYDLEGDLTVPARLTQLDRAVRVLQPRPRLGALMRGLAGTNVELTDSTR